MIVTVPKKFYGLALSFFPRHGLNVCAMVDKGDRKIVKDKKRSFHIEPNKVGKDGFEKLQRTVKSLASAQKKENEKDGLHYSVPITIGWPGENRVEQLAYLKTDNPAVMWEEPEAGDDLSEQIRLRLLKQVHSVDPNYNRDATKVGLFRDTPDEGFPTEIRDAETDQALNTLHREAVGEGNTESLYRLIERGIRWASLMAEDMRGRGIERARVNRFFLFADPEVRWLNIPEVVSAMKNTLRNLIGISRQQEIDLKFTNSPKADPFFNVTRPEMATQIRQALKQKFYGMAISFYDKKLKATVMVDNGDRTIKADQERSWSIDNEAEVKNGVAKLLQTVSEVANLQDEENKRCGNHKYIFPVTIGWPDDKDSFMVIKNQIDNSIKEATSDDFQFDTGSGTYSKHILNDTESPESVTRAQNLLSYYARKGHPEALRELIIIGIAVANNIADRLIAEAPPGEDSNPRFIKIPHPDDQYLNVPEVVAAMAQVLQKRFDSLIPIDLKFADDEQSPQFYNVNRPSMEALIGEALAFD